MYHTFSTSGALALPTWIQLKYPNVQKLTSFRLRVHADSIYTSYPLTWQLQGSNDGAAFTTVQTYSANNWTSLELRDFDVDSPVFFKIWRINILTVTPNATTYRNSVFNDIIFNTDPLIMSASAISNTQFNLMVNQKTSVLRCNILLTMGSSIVNAGLYEFNSTTGTATAITTLS